MTRYLLALLLAGCAVTYRPNAYEWYQDMPPSEYYRWEVVDDPTLCWRPIADAWLSGWACAIRLNAGVIRPGDKRIDSGPVRDEEGRLCVIFASMSEDEAKRLPSKWESRSLFAHEMEHCATGRNHREVYR